ncbi:AAA family ATPase [Methylovulum psychrotolerans]|uniref:ATP-binding protein n=1 Tax=Methylovulum psychrotolerans TaxID=1704499 RepID=A0A2S5CPW8_9GAMM|nr:AAA family ATPase [Methylovulum psychrotolerans]POZ52843.1 ATP-binding protein [Methylovulum psychrotolerans]
MDGHFLTDIAIKQFKCFSDFQVSGFKRVNLIGGKNNIGKTALLEACFINVYSESIDGIITAIHSIKFARENLNLLADKANNVNSQQLIDTTRIYAAKSTVSDTAFSILEENGIKEYHFTLQGELTSINGKDLNITAKRINNIEFIDNYGWSNQDLISAFQAIQKQDKESELNTYIRAFDDSIENFKVIGDKPQCKTNGIYRDISEFGDGLRHYISIICALYQCENGYLFIDEIDNGIHYSQLDRLWDIILSLSKQNQCQVFATTHSKEMLEALVRAAQKQADSDISYTILVKNKQAEVKTISLDYDMLLDSMTQGYEVR